MSTGAPPYQVLRLLTDILPYRLSFSEPRNNARVIPDGKWTRATRSLTHAAMLKPPPSTSGVITAAHFVKTPNYVQIQGFFDGTKINIMSGDEGGELDPHGASASSISPRPTTQSN